MTPKDIISEEDFIRETIRNIPKSPQRDSPGDSATNQELEVEMGINYQPSKPKNRKKDIPAFDRGH